jgi:hypothetical protein
MPMTMGGPEISGRRESDRSGLRVLLYVLLALGGVGVLTCAGLLFVAARNPAVRQFAETIAGSHSAPGTQQLRDAGCAVAQVFDIGSALAQLSEFNNREIDEVDALTGLTLVQCVRPRKNSGGLDCDEVAQVYSSAVSDPPDRFLVQVMVQFSSQTNCQVVYDADGSPIAPLEQYDPDAMPGVGP